jgi:hypothetical protein
MHLKILHLELVKLIYYLLCKIEGGYEYSGCIIFKLLYQIVSDENTALTQAQGKSMTYIQQPNW